MSTRSAPRSIASWHRSTRCTSPSLPWEQRRICTTASSSIKPPTVSTRPHVKLGKLQWAHPASTQGTSSWRILSQTRQQPWKGWRLRKSTRPNLLNPAQHQPAARSHAKAPHTMLPSSKARHHLNPHLTLTRVTIARRIITSSLAQSSELCRCLTDAQLSHATSCAETAVADTAQKTANPLNDAKLVLSRIIPCCTCRRHRLVQCKPLKPPPRRKKHQPTQLIEK